MHLAKTKICWWLSLHAHHLYNLYIWLLWYLNSQPQRMKVPLQATIIFSLGIKVPLQTTIEYPHDLMHYLGLESAHLCEKATVSLTFRPLLSIETTVTILITALRSFSQLRNCRVLLCQHNCKSTFRFTLFPLSCLYFVSMNVFLFQSSLRTAIWNK